MPIKSPFKRSLLNVQPLPEKKSSPVVNNLTDKTTPDPSRGFDETSIGFSTVITRQTPPTSDSSDAISLTGKGSNDSLLASSVSSDPERPELISLTAPFRAENSTLAEILKLRDFEASVDESDLSYIYARLAESEISKDIEKRAATVESFRNDLELTNSALMEIVSKIEKFRDSSDFLLNNHSIHRGSLKYVSSLPRKYGEDVQSMNPTFEKTFHNIEGAYRLSSTSLVNLLIYTLLYPGSSKFETVENGNSSLSRFNVPVIKTDPVNQLLTSISGIDVKTAEGFLSAESLLPQDPVSRVALISEALSYELGLSVGLSKINSSDMVTYIQQFVGTTPNLISSPPAPGTVVSAMRDGNTLLLENRDAVIDGVQYPGVLSSLIDSAIASGIVEFPALSSLTQGMSEKFSKLLQDVLLIRTLNDKEESISPTGIITLLAEAVRSGTSSVEKYLETNDSSTLSQQQMAQLLLLKELANSSGSSEILESRFRTFLEIVSQTSESVTVEDSTAASEEKKVSVKNRKTSNGSEIGEKIKLKIKSTQNGEDTIEVENLATDTPVVSAASTSINRPSISSVTTSSRVSGFGTSKSSVGFGVSKSSSSSKTNASYASKTRSNSTSETKSSSSSEKEKVTDSATQDTQGNEKIHETFTGKGGSGHISSTYSTNFDIALGGSSQPAVSTRSNIFERYGLTLGVAGLLGIGDIARRSLSGEDITLTLKSLLELGTLSVVSTPNENITEETGTVVHGIETIQSAQNEIVIEPIPESQKNKRKLESTFGTIPFKYSSRSSSEKPTLRRPKRSSYRIAGMSTVTERRHAEISSTRGGQISPTPVKKRQQDLVTTNSAPSVQSNSSSVRSEDIYGLATDRQGIKRYSNTISKTTSSPSLLERSLADSQMRKSDSVIPKESNSSIIDTIMAASKTKDKKIGVDPSLVSKQIIPESKQAEISTEYKSFFTLFPNAEGASSQITFTVAMSSIKDSLRYDKVYDSELLSGTFRRFVSQLLEISGNLVGDPEAFDSATTNYGLDKSIIEFLCYSMFVSMCSCISGVTGSGVTKSGRQDFDILLTPQLDIITPQQNLVKGISNYVGALSEFIMRFEGYPTEITMFDSLRYAEKVTETLKTRWAVLQSFLTTYTSAVAEVTGLSSNKRVVEAIEKINKRGETSLLSDMTYETVSSAQLIASKLRGPLKLDRRTRQYRTASSNVPLFLAGFSSKTAKDSSIACVGIPSRSLEFLRRKYQSDENIAPPAGKEYVEVVFTKQDLQFPDLVLRSSTYRFCPTLEVIVQPTTEKTIQSAMGDFVYLCHSGNDWEVKNLSEALDFVVESTGLDEMSSYVVIVNHVIDALCNVTNFALGSFETGDTVTRNSERVISTQASDLVLKAMKSSVGGVLPRGLMLPGDFLERDTRGYRFLRFSSLNPGVVKLTNESNHRLLGHVLTDPLFTAENLYALGTCFTPFERTYNCVIDPDEFVIDKSQTLATSGGRSNFSLLVKQEAIDVYPEVAVFREGTDAKILESSTYAAKVELVTI
jgi:hypothetical protein